MLALLSKLFNLAEGWGIRPDGSNPCRHREKFKEQARDRHLTAAELSRLGDALRQGLASQAETPHMVAAIQLLLLTGARLNELLTARWEWVDFDARVIRLPDSKTGSKRLFLSQPAVDILQGLKALPGSAECPYVLRGRLKDRPLVNLSKPWKRICARAGLDSVRIMVFDTRRPASGWGKG